MKYEGSIYRPPSEARSLIVQVAVGCDITNVHFAVCIKIRALELNHGKK